MSIAGTIYERDILKGWGKLVSAQLTGNVASVVFTPAVLTAEFDSYLFDLTDVSCTVVSALYLHGSIDGGATWLTTGAYYAAMYSRSNNVAAAFNGNNIATINVGGTQNAVGYPLGGEITWTKFNPPGLATRHFIFNSSCYEGPECMTYNGSGYFSEQEVNAVKFQYNAGNIGSGVFRCYGLRRGIII